MYKLSRTRLRNNRVYELIRPLQLAFIVLAMGIVLASTVFTNKLAKSLAEEERRKVEIWADAMKELIQSDNNPQYLNFLVKIIEGNNTIPIIIADEKGKVIITRNVEEPKSNTKEFYGKLIKNFESKHNPIIIPIDKKEKQIIYYDDSLLLKKLTYFPYIQWGVITLFMILFFYAFSSSKKAEQNHLWVGLSKETAHQLGTPISSLLAWIDLLKIHYSEDKLINDMKKDVDRLKIISERFSKIGSTPDLQIVSLNETLQHAVNYISRRTSQKVVIKCLFGIDETIFIRLNVPLFEWVIENLCKNAIDAMNGIGNITITLTDKPDEVLIDVTDTGKGIEKKKFKTIFNPGFTTKERGWGLGLSLAKRIIEEYHKGKIFVKQSNINSGTTFRIILKH